MKKTLIMLLALLMCGLLFAGCAQEKDDAKENALHLTSSLFGNTYTFQHTNTMTNGKAYEVLLTQMDMDNDVCYFCIRIGSVENVIVDDFSKSIYYSGGMNAKVTYEKSQVTSTSIETQTSWLSQRLEYDNNLAGIEVELGAEFNPGVTKFINKFNTKFGAQFYQNTTTTTNGGSQTDKTEQILTERQTVELVFDNSCAPGYYRISHVMDYDVFVLVAKSLTDDSYNYTTYTLPRKNMIEVYEYSSDKFEDPKFDSLPFDDSIVADLKIPDASEITKPSENDTRNFAGGDGSEKSPYLISTKEHLENMRSYCYSTGVYFKLVDDIDLENEDFNSFEYWLGNFDGSGKIIKNFHLCSESNSAGLFNECKGTIKRLTVYNATLDMTIHGENIKAGIIVGDLYDGGRVLDCHVDHCSISANARDSVNTPNGGRWSIVGGVVGKSLGEISDCSIRSSSVCGSVLKHDKDESKEWDEVAYLYIGGILGEQVGGSVINCTAESLSKFSGKAEYRCLSSISNLNAKAKTMIAAGGVIGRKGETLLESGNKSYVSTNLFDFSSNAWSDSNIGSADHIHDEYFGEVVGKPH